MIVRVAIDLALDRLFDYEVPEALQGKLAVGQLLSVPFGSREARGFAMAVARQEGQERLEGQVAKGQRGLKSRERMPGFTLKPITAIVDETPFFSPNLLTLVKKVAAYTAAPIESVLKAALPAAVLKRNARAKEQLYVEPVDSLSSLSPLVSEAGERQERREGLEGQGAKCCERHGLSSRQRWLCDQIVRLDGGWLAQLCRELKTTPASLRALAEKGLVRIEVKAKRRDPLGSRRILPTNPLALNPEQAAVLESIVSNNQTIKQSNNQTILLHGITGSGKTEVYLQAIAHELSAGRGAIVMVPEIALTPQTVQRFASRFGDRVAVLHSALSDGERYDEWHRIRSGAARVVVGPRSAVWAPVRDLGLIVVDEEHESSYKQDETPRYNARDVAVLRGAIEGAKVVLGSATPSLESWHNAETGKYRLATMMKRAGAGTLPVIRLVEMGNSYLGTGNGVIFSHELLDAIRLRLDRHEQTILFLNRRGYARQVVCEACAAVITCPNCSTADRGMPYTYHRADQCLRCHICGGWIPLPAKCPACGQMRLTYRGIGTQRAEAALKICFKNARVLRMDADSTSRKNSHDDILGAFRRGEADILVGTQMIAKGLDFPNVTLVGVLNADSALSMPDFRASERAFQLFAQVAGRAGRAELPGEVFVQTYDTSNPVLGAVLKGNFAAFAASELSERQAAYFPPYCHLATVNLRSRDLRLVGDWASMYAASLSAYARKVNEQPRRQQAGRFLVSEAVPSALEKADGWFRWQIVLRASTNGDIVRAWRWISAERPLPKSLLGGLDADALNLV